MIRAMSEKERKQAERVTRSMHLEARDRLEGKPKKFPKPAKDYYEDKIQRMLTKPVWHCRIGKIVLHKANT